MIIEFDGSDDTALSPSLGVTVEQSLGTSPTTTSFCCCLVGEKAGSAPQA